LYASNAKPSPKRNARGWEAHFADDDAKTEFVVDCPRCALGSSTTRRRSAAWLAREFGRLRSSAVVPLAA
jgi:hypothetical protein